jgi:hypothetical protein
MSRESSLTQSGHSVRQALTAYMAGGEKLATKFVIDAGADNALVEFDGNVRD